MTVFLILLLVATSLVTVIYVVSTLVNAWKGKGWFMRLIMTLILVFFEVCLLDALNWIPGLFK